MTVKSGAWVNACPGCAPVAAIAAFKADNRSFAIVGEGRTENELSVVVLEDGKYLGFGFISKTQPVENFESAKELIEPYKDNREVQTIIHSYLQNNSNYQVMFPGVSIF